MQRRSLLATAAFAAAPRAVLAQTPGSWPARPIRIILPTPPGGPADVILRAVERLKRRDRQVFRTEEAPQDVVDAILNAEIPEDAKQFDHEVR